MPGTGRTAVILSQCGNETKSYRYTSKTIKQFQPHQFHRI